MIHLLLIVLLSVALPAKAQQFGEPTQWGKAAIVQEESDDCVSLSIGNYQIECDLDMFERYSGFVMSAVPFILTLNLAELEDCETFIDCAYIGNLLLNIGLNIKLAHKKNNYRFARMMPALLCFGVLGLGQMEWFSGSFDNENIGHALTIIAILKNMCDLFPICVKKVDNQAKESPRELDTKYIY